MKITALKTTLDKELSLEYGAEGLTACPMLREGQVFRAGYAKPQGLCDEAWKAIYQYVFALAHGTGYASWERRRKNLLRSVKQTIKKAQRWKNHHSISVPFCDYKP